jgi:phage repressor protein C with HTH and peptisase S24 domain
MMPTISDHDIVVVDRTEQRPQFGDKIWAIIFGGVAMIKRLRPMPDGSVTLSSDNQLVRDVRAVGDELHIVGRVVAIVRRSEACCESW